MAAGLPEKVLLEELQLALAAFFLEFISSPRALGESLFLGVASGLSLWSSRQGLGSSATSLLCSIPSGWLWSREEELEASSFPPLDGKTLELQGIAFPGMGFQGIGFPGMGFQGMGFQRMGSKTWGSKAWGPKP